MERMKRIIYSIIIICLSGSSIFAGGFYQGTYGVYFAYNSNMHKASFPKLPGIPNCCPNFERGDGSGFSLGIEYERNIENNLKFAIRVGYSSLNAVLTQTEGTVINIDGEIIDGEFEYILDSELSVITLEPVFTYTPVDGLGLGAGLSIGPYIGQAFNQKEQITKPDGYGTFLDAEGNDTYSRVRHEYSGDIPDANAYYVSLLCKISYDFPLDYNRSLFISPEISYYYNITPVIKGLSWNAHTLKFGISVFYAGGKGIL